MERFANGCLRAHGRADDSMNLGGIKVSSLQIEEVVATVDGIVESAAVAVPPSTGGPDRLVVYVVTTDPTNAEKAHREAELQVEIQTAIRNRLNPLFKLHRVVILPSLPRTASNKIMRRTLRNEFMVENSPPPAD